MWLGPVRDLDRMTPPGCGLWFIFGVASAIIALVLFLSYW